MTNDECFIAIPVLLIGVKEGLVSLTCTVHCLAVRVHPKH